jgi:hypothetical protein
MITTSHPLTNAGFAVAAALLVTSCAPFQRSAPQQTHASNPTVSYGYHTDDELIQTNQLAATFCGRYQNTTARAMRFKDTGNGERGVEFECVPTSSGTMASYNPNLTYTYRTDQELVDVSRNARTYCMNAGASDVTTNIVSNGDGTRTVTFQCRR